MARSLPIETQRLFIKPFSKEHLTNTYIGWLNSKEIVLYSEQRFCKHTLESCREYLKSFDNTPNHFWAIVTKDVACHIGNINAYVDVKNQTADVGIMIGEKKVWGKGYGLEAWNAVFDYLFKQENLRKVTAGTISPNKAMLKIMEKAKMVKDGRRIKHFLWDGEEVDVIHMAAFKENWVSHGYNK